MTFYEFVSIVNFLLPTIAAIGYLIRIVNGLKRHDYHKYRIMLPLFLLAAVGMSVIYFLNITGLWRAIYSDFEVYSRIVVRPYFTYLGSLLVLAAWIHPELHPIIVKAKELLWTLVHGLIFKKK